MKNTIWFHIDVNSAFLSWTAVELLKAGAAEDIREVPSIIGGDMTKRHGVVLAKSVPAKAYGIKTGEPVTDAYKKCPHLKSYPPNHHKYKEYSDRLMKLLAEYSPEIVQYSIDECFLRYVPGAAALKPFGSPDADRLLTGAYKANSQLLSEAGISRAGQSLRAQAVADAFKIKDRICRELLFTVNIGISENKLLAKMASDFEKPDKVHTLFPEEIQKKMWPLPVSELFMVGRATAEKLRLLGIKTIGDLAKTDVGILTAHLKSHGKTIWEFANGIEGTPIDGRAHTENKGIGNMTTLSQDLSDKTEIFEVLRELAEKVAGRLRASGQQAGLVCVEIKYADFMKATHQMQLLSPTNVSDTIYRAACRLFEEVWKGYPVRLLGIRTSKLSKTGQQQMNLFDMAKSEKMQKLDKALDEIRERYGTSAVVRGSKMHVQRLGWDSEIPEDDF